MIGLNNTIIQEFLDNTVKIARKKPQVLTPAAFSASFR
jgi:hypothetical protein